MGIGFVLIVWILIAGILLVPTSAALGALGWYVTRRKSRRMRRRFMLGGIFLPVAGAAYLFGCVIGLMSDHDVGIGDGFDVPLPHHYHWSAIDEPTVANIYDTGDSRVTDGNIPDDDRNGFANVLRLQLAGDWLAGGFMEDYDPAHDKERSADHWFLFDTLTHERIDASSEEELRAIARAHGISLKLQSSEDFYGSHCRTWLDIAVLLLLFALMVLALLKIGGIGWRMWRDDPGPAPVGESFARAPSANP